MRLNPDCVRDILMCLEEETRPGGFLSFTVPEWKEKFQRLQRYSDDEIAYHLDQCDMSGFLHEYRKNFTGEHYQVTDITPKAHSFLENIRSDTVWNGVKSVAAKVGSKSLEALVAIASNVVTELIKAQFGLSP